eukprot:PITA_03046
MGFNMLMGSSMTNTVRALFIAFFFIGAAKLDLPPSLDDFDFFYFVQQWPGSSCNTKAGCCYPTAGKPPSTFLIQGLWPNFNDSSYPKNCDSSYPFNPSQISDLRKKMDQYWGSLDCPSSNSLKFWEEEWEQYGTCSEHELNQHDYFAAALRLKESVDLLGALEKAGIRPDGGSYTVSRIQNAIPVPGPVGIECNTDESGNYQLYQIYLCVDPYASNFISCPVLPNSQCGFPVFPSF